VSSAPWSLQVRLTGGIQQMLPSFLPSFLFGVPVALDKLVIDNERHILYSLAANSAIQVCSFSMHTCVLTACCAAAYKQALAYVCMLVSCILRTADQYHSIRRIHIPTLLL
jgi:hypothetical protein